ncbi:MAG: class I SAM-dependent methyltransferase [Myxococcota bacterium]
MADWTEQKPEFVARRYDRLARFYGVFEWLYGLPLLGIRSKTVAALQLHGGEIVLELGCGSGRNFARLERAVGPHGRVLGVDLSPGMLARARGLCERHGWSNVELTQADAAASVPGVRPNAILFCFSYSVMPERRRVLADAWNLLLPRGRLVITDLSMVGARGFRFLLPFACWYSRRTLLGKPDTEPWSDLAAHAAAVEVERWSLGSLGHFVICRALKEGGPESN